MSSTGLEKSSLIFLSCVGLFYVDKDKGQTKTGQVCTAEDEGYLPFLTISFVALLQGRSSALVLALKLGHTSRVLLDQLAGLAVVFPNQLLHLLVLFSLLPNKTLLLLQLFHGLSLEF